MGTLTVHEAQHVIDLELSGWALRVISSGGGLCNFKNKEIWVDQTHMNIPFLLHEIAHALAPDIKDHNAVWADLYTALLEKYLGHCKINTQINQT